MAGSADLLKKYIYKKPATFFFLFFFIEYILFVKTKAGFH